MSVEPVSLDRARAAKAVLLERLGGHPAVVGIGLTRRETGWALKVNLRRAAPDLQLPAELDGTPIVTEVVGRIVARGG